MPEISKTGKWIDTKTGKVVESEPEEGRLLVAPGGVVTPTVQADIARAEADLPAADDAVVATEKDDKVETASTDSKVETATADDKTKPRSTK